MTKKMHFTGLFFSQRSEAAIVLSSAPWRLYVGLHSPGHPAICIERTWGAGPGAIHAQIWARSFEDVRDHPYHFYISSGRDGSIEHDVLKRRGDGSLEEVYDGVLASVAELKTLPAPSTWEQVKAIAAAAVEVKRIEREAEALATPQGHWKREAFERDFGHVPGTPAADRSRVAPSRTTAGVIEGAL